ncbi:MAG: OprO/OprP family phosphate-selective porin [Flavobacteriaceae bacterium]|nr:OprO/OprP family phosphate-selective porin [Flavobacteriaceae bacterium]
MKTIRLLFCAFLFSIVGVSAQTETDSIVKAIENNDIKLAALPYYSYGKGLGLTSADSLFQFNIRFRMQNRATALFLENEESAFSAQVRRLRLRFDGYVGDPKFSYVIQLSFAAGDVGVIQEGQNINVIRDAIVFYRPNKNWNLGFGQTKLPGNRQRINSSGALQFTDRTINNAQFNIDRDFGLQVYYLKNKPDAFGYEIKTAISTGEGRNWTQTSDNKMAYTGRVELYPFGNFTKGGAYFEGDLMRETTPKLMISGTYHFNHGALRTQGQQGSVLYEPRDLTSILLDAILKYNGWAFQTAYLQRDTDNAITINPNDATQQRFVLAGSGYDAQLSYLFLNNLEVSGRYSYSTPKSQIKNILPETNQFSLGITKYIWEHSLKIQGEATYESATLDLNPSNNSWYVRFQVEIGI